MISLVPGFIFRIPAVQDKMAILILPM